MGEMRGDDDLEASPHASPGPPTVAVCGEVVIDLALERPASGPPTLAARAGGSPANTAVGLARLAQPVELLARLAPDHLGALARRHLEGAGVRLDHAVAAAEPQSVALVTCDSAGEATYRFYLEGAADFAWCDAELVAALGPDVAVLHTGSLAALREPGARAVRALMARARRDRLVSYDPNLRAGLRDPVDLAAGVEACVRLAHLVKASVADCALAYPGDLPATVARRWLGLGAHLVVLTSGVHGATAYDAEGTHSAPGLTVTVADSVGAGDAFAAALLAALCARGATRALRTGPLSPEVLLDALDGANAAAALTCTRQGADPPTRAELAAFRAGGA